MIMSEIDKGRKKRKRQRERSLSGTAISRRVRFDENSEPDDSRECLPQSLSGFGRPLLSVPVVGVH